MDLLLPVGSIVSINKKIDDCYNDKLEGNITLDMYKRTYNNLTLQIKSIEYRALHRP